MNNKICVCRNAVLLLAASVFFGLFNSFLAWFAFVPVLFLIKYSSLKTCWIYGGLYGILSYTILVFWLVKYSFSAMAGAWILYFVYCGLLFFILKILDLYCGRFAFLFQFAVLILYEYLKTVGFFGFSYGVSGYTQWKNLNIIQTADFSGVWGITALVDFSSFAVFMLISDFVDSKNGKRLKLRKVTLISCALEIILVLFSFIYGKIRINEIEKRDGLSGKIKIIAVQNNTDPWKNGLSAYWNDYSVLKKLTNQALVENPDADIVLWPETAIVPSIKTAWYLRKDSERTEFVENLLEYIDSKKCAFVLGNFNSDFENDKDYNSVFFFEPGKNVIPPQPEEYSKIHLVPLSEYFPYDKQFPHIYKILLNGDSHLWTPGSDYKVFEYRDFKFSTPICFEDTFGKDCRRFADNGAKAFLNLSNDAWSSSKRCQMQHLQMAVFRSIENHVPTVRSSVSGETCYISSCGKVVQRCRSFEEGYICCEIPVLVATE